MCGWNMISHVHGANGRSFLLRKRRLQGNLLETYTILRGFGAIDPRESFSFRELKELRVHLLTLVRARVRTIFKQTFFAIVVVNLMKRLSEVIVVPPYIASIPGLSRHGANISQVCSILSCLF